MTEIVVPMPLGGVSDDVAFSEQEPATTRESFNMRADDPTNGRERISTRAGQSKAMADPIEAAVPVAEIVATTFDNRNLVYSFVDGSETEEWTKELPGKAASLMGVTDFDGNVYCLDGNASVAKLNPDGTLNWQFSLPVQDTSHVARFVIVDELLDVYAGVSEGTVQTNTRLWKIRQLPDNEVELAWELKLTAYVETAKVIGDKLYTLQNEPDMGIAFVRIYSDLDAAQPVLSQQFRVPFHANDMDVNSAGDVFVASDHAQAISSSNILVTPNEMFRINPRFPEFSAEAQDWTPYKLTDWDRRIWSWLEADDIGEFDVNGPFADGAFLRRWPDRARYGRHLYPITTPTPFGAVKPPQLALRACGVHSAVRFNGIDQVLQSLVNSSTALAYADQQRTLWPGYISSAFCSILVVRPVLGLAATDIRCLMGQDNETTGGEHMILVNQLAQESVPGPFSSGKICHYTGGGTDGAFPASGLNTHPLEGNFVNENGLAIVAILWDGAIDATVPTSTTKTRSLFQVNGHPIDRYLSFGSSSKGPTYVGHYSPAAFGVNVFFYKGDILAMFSLDRINRGVDGLSLADTVLTHDRLQPPDADVDQTSNELTQLLGYFGHRFGVSHLLPKESQSYTHPFGRQTETIDLAVLTDTLAGPPLSGHTGPYRKFQTNLPCLTKYSSRGVLVWAIDSLDDDALSAGDLVSGVGYGVRVDFEGNLISMGPAIQVKRAGNTTTVASNFIRKVIDQGTTYSLAAVDGAWGTDITEPTYHFPRMAVDSFGNVYVPSADNADGLLVLRGTDGVLLSGVTIGSPARDAYAIALDPKIPDYRTDLATKLARFVYVFHEAVTTSPMASVTKIRLVQETPITGSARQLYNIGISRAGTIRRFEVGGAVTTPTDVAGKLSATPFIVHAVSHLGKIYITDGVSPIVVIDPLTNTASVLTSSSGGEPPHGCRILESWNGRLLGARSPALLNGAFGWLMSKRGGPTDWHTSPPERNSASAIGGQNIGGPGPVPDIVNAFVPYNDDLAYWGCDHSIYQMTGDPGEGGVFDLVTDVTGMAFGRPWCKDPLGNVWFVGSRGGLFLVAPGSRPQRVSLRNIDARLAAIDFSTHTVKLVWNDDEHGVHIFRIPLGTPGDPTEHYWWDAQRGGAWPDTFEESVEPTAAYLIDSDDPNDRLLLLGGRDGFIRKWDVTADTDDGEPIVRSVLVGPFSRGTVPVEQRYVGPRVVLANEQGGCRYELFATDDPSVLGPPRHSGELVAGRNQAMRTRVRGAYCYLRFLSRQLSRFAIEEAGMMAYPAGRKRVRETT